MIGNSQVKGTLMVIQPELEWLIHQAIIA